MSAENVLVIDDEPQIRRVMRSTLSGHGYVITEATSGEEGDARDERLAAGAVRDQVGDREQGEVVLGGEGLEVGESAHGAVVVDELAEHAGGVVAGEAGEVDGGFGVAGAFEHAAAFGA